MKTPKISRRRFLIGTGIGAAAFQIAPVSALGGANRPGPNERLNIAGIGVGSRGGSDIAAMAREGQNIVALCDVHESYAGKTFKRYPKAKRFKDYRVMFDKMDKEIDAVVIGTPDHTHAVIAMEAMRRRKHVYCEKPLAHSIHEVRSLMAAAREYKVVTQLGNQGHSSNDIRRFCEWIWAGAIGQVRVIHAACDAFKNVYCQLRNLDKLNKHYDVPKDLDYNLWLGPVPYRPYTPFYLPWNWRGWLPFGTGCIGDWVCHVIDPSFWALNLGAPTSVRAEVWDYDPAKHGLTYPPAARITYHFPDRDGRGPIKLVWHDGNDPIPRPEGFPKDDKIPGVGAVVIGEKGMIVHGSHGAGGCRLVPDALMDAYSGKNAPARKIPRVKNHAWDWIEAIRTGRQAGSNFAFGGPLTEIALLGAIAIRFPGQTLEWDGAGGRFLNSKEANAYIVPTFREGWRLL